MFDFVNGINSHKQKASLLNNISEILSCSVKSYINKSKVFFTNTIFSQFIDELLSITQIRSIPGRYSELSKSVSRSFVLMEINDLIVFAE